MKILVDMNLSPLWCDVLRGAGHEPRHWSEVGDPRAPDDTIMEWARASGSIVFTHDLDFGAILWATRASGPSVLQLRGDEVLPSVVGTLVNDALLRFQAELQSGALLVLDQNRSRIRILPLG